MLHVTQAIALCGLIDEDHRDEFALQRGTAVHLATALDDRGDLDQGTIDPVHVAPRLTSWRQFRAETGCEILEVERDVVNEAMLYRGRLDRLVRLETAKAVLDIKCGQPEPWHAYQTALYAMAWAAETEEATPLRACVYLHPEGKRPRFVLHKDRRDFERAKAIITVANIRIEAGAKP